MLRRRIDAPVICRPEELLLSSVVIRIEEDVLQLAGAKETKATYGQKLRKAALALTPSYVKKTCTGMKKRVQGVYAAKGHHYKKD